MEFTHIGWIGLFGAGLLTFLSPCVLPLAPILAASWIVADSSRWARVRSTLWFSLGFTLAFVALGMGAASLGAIGGGVFARAKPFLFIVAAAIFGLFALRMLGAFGNESWLAAKLSRSFQFKGDLGSRVPRGMSGLVFGLVFGLGWTPCVGPVLGAVLTYVASRQASALRGAAMLLVFSLGISLPLLAVALGLEKVKPVLARLRSWLPKIEYATGLGLLIFAALLLNQARLGFQMMSRGGWSEEGVLAFDHHGKTVALGAKSPAAELVFFYSKHCPICHAMERYLPEYERDCSTERFRFEKIDVDLPENEAAAERFGVRAVPTISVLDPDGKELMHWVGYQTEGRLREAARMVGGLVCAKGDGATHPAPFFPGKSESCQVGKSC